MSSAPTSPTAPRMLVLWDVDHTLIETRGVGRAIYDRAFPAATGKPLAKLASISGRTELAIVTESLRVNGIEPTDDNVKALANELTHGYQDARHELGTVGRALPGARATLADLAANPVIHQSVLTGNLRTVARIKLEVFHLDPYLDLDSGAYGDDDQDRSALVHIAIRRASTRTNSTFSAESTVLLGDTPNDVEAGLAADVQVIGVATGKTTATDLREAGAHHVAANLSECRDIVTQLARHLNSAPTGQQGAPTARKSQCNCQASARRDDGHRTD